MVMKRTLLTAGVFLLFLSGLAFGVNNPKVLIRVSKPFTIDIGIELYANEAPVSVDNFLAYMYADFYDGLIFHRSDWSNQVVQTGAYEPNTVEPNVWDVNPRFPIRDPIINESYNGLSNLFGTIGMARTSEPNSATSQFYFNMNDNVGFDRANYPDGYGYCVFGRVISNMNFVNWIFYLPTASISGLPNVPLWDDGQKYNYIVITDIMIAPPGYWLREDFDNSGRVDEGDIGFLEGTNWLANGVSQTADLSGDGTVNFQDYALWAKKYMQTTDWHTEP